MLPEMGRRGSDENLRPSRVTIRRRPWKRRTASFVIGMLLVGLGTLAAGHDTAKSCGSYELRPGIRGTPFVEQQCLVEAFGAGRSARLSIQARTVEGDPFGFDYRVLAAGLVLVRVDGTRDRYGPRKLETYRCRDLAVGPERP